MVLWCNQIAELKTANKTINQWKQHKKKHIQQGGVFTFEAGRQLFDKDFATATSSSKKSWGKATADGVKPTQRHYNNCGGTGHNAQTCQNNEESTVESSSNKESEVDYSGVE